MINFYDKQKNNDRTTALANALQAARLNTTNQISPFQPVAARGGNGGSNESALGGASNLLTGATKLYGALKDNGVFGGSNGYFGSINDPNIDTWIKGGTSEGLSPIGSAINDNVIGNANNSSLIGDAINNNVLGEAGGGFMGNVAPYSGAIFGGLRAGQEALNGGSFKDDVPQAFFGIDDSNDSEIMQSLKGAGQGALMGVPFGPIGMAVGGTLGLGASFLDDIKG